MEKKFRAWDKKSKRWYKTELEFYGFSIFGECTLICPPKVSDLQNLVITQYTGIKDKNGKDVYESDIVKDGAGQINEVVYRMGGYWFNWLHLIDAVEPLEVIGNIYENPELLDKP